MPLTNNTQIYKKNAPIQIGFKKVLKKRIELIEIAPNWILYRQNNTNCERYDYSDSFDYSRIDPPWSAC